MTEPVTTAPPAPRYRWYHKVSAVIFIAFCIELGTTLVLLPWSNLWGVNFWASLSPHWRAIWNNAYFRGAVSGLGVLNVYIALIEIFRLRRFARQT